MIEKNLSEMKVKQ